MDIQQDRQDDGNRKSFRIPLRDAEAKNRELVLKQRRFHDEHVDKSQEDLARRLEEVNQTIAEADAEFTLRKIASGGMNESATKRFYEAASDALIEREVIQRLLPSEGEVIGVSRDRSHREVVHATIAAEAAKERAEVLAAQYEQERQEARQMDRLVEKTKGLSGSTIDQAMRHEAQRREIRN